MVSVRRQWIAICAVLALVAGPSRGHAQASHKIMESRKPFAALSDAALAMTDSVVARARSQIGTRYKLGGTSPSRGLDCSGFVKYVMSAFEVVLPRTAAQQSKVGQTVPKDLAALKPGDLLTFGRGKRITHVGIYVGDGRMVHASTSQRRIVETSLTARSPLIKQWKGVRRLMTGAKDSLLAIADTLR